MKENIYTTPEYLSTKTKHFITKGKDLRLQWRKLLDTTSSRTQDDHISKKISQSHVPPDRLQGEPSTTFVMFLSKMNNLHLIIRKQQTNSNWQTYYKIMICLQVSRSQKSSKDWEGNLLDRKKPKKSDRQRQHVMLNRHLCYNGHYWDLRWSWAETEDWIAGASTLIYWVDSHVMICKIPSFGGNTHWNLAVWESIPSTLYCNSQVSLTRPQKKYKATFQ